MESLSFWDLKGKKKFNSTDYKIVSKSVKGNTRKFAVALAPSGIQSWRIVSKNF
jgi:hypothetical protein